MYAARISRETPALFVVLIDQSGSMEEPTLFYGSRVSKAEAVASTVNMLLSELLYRSRREEGYRDYFHIAVLGYGAEQVERLLPRTGAKLMTPSKLYELQVPVKRWQKERLLPDGRTTISVLEQRQWVAPKAVGQTPMYEALVQAYELVKEWCATRTHRESYPPVIFNITDGEASDGDDVQLQEMSDRIRSLGTSDGNALFVNIHITSDCSQPPVVFASEEEQLPESRYAHLLYRMSSVMPSVYNEQISALCGCGRPPYRGMSYNASMSDLIGMLNIGSVSVTLMD